MDGVVCIYTLVGIDVECTFISYLFAYTNAVKFQWFHIIAFIYVIKWIKKERNQQPLHTLQLNDWMYCKIRPKQQFHDSFYFTIYPFYTYFSFHFNAAHSFARMKIELIHKWNISNIEQTKVVRCAESNSERCESVFYSIDAEFRCCNSFFLVIIQQLLPLSL